MGNKGKVQKLDKFSLGLTGALIVFFVNPLWLVACIGGEEEPELNFGAAEMEAELAEAARTYTVQGDDGAFEVTVKNADIEAMAALLKPTLSPFVTSATACGYTESFVAGARACVSFTGAEMTSEGTLSVSWLPEEGEPNALRTDASTTNRYTVEGVDLDNGILEVSASDVIARFSTSTGDGRDFELVGLSVNGFDYAVNEGMVTEAR